MSYSLRFSHPNPMMPDLGEFEQIVSMGYQSLLPFWLKEITGISLFEECRGEDYISLKFALSVLVRHLKEHPLGEEAVSKWMYAHGFEKEMETGWATWELYVQMPNRYELPFQDFPSYAAWDVTSRLKTEATRFLLYLCSGYVLVFDESR